MIRAKHRDVAGCQLGFCCSGPGKSRRGVALGTGSKKSSMLGKEERLSTFYEAKTPREEERSVRKQGFPPINIISSPLAFAVALNHVIFAAVIFDSLA